jgi:linoleate 9S-lipoxygenase
MVVLAIDITWYSMNMYAAMEPFVVSTSWHISQTHPVHKLLSPHYCDTMTINVLVQI